MQWAACLPAPARGGAIRMSASRTTLDDVLRVAQAYVTDNHPRRRAIRVRLDLDDGEQVRLIVPEGPPAASPRPQARHSADFRSISWFGQEYTFTPSQAACLGILWETWEDGVPAVGQETILERAGLERTGRLRDVFKDHPCWGALIQPGTARGSFRLVEP